MLTGAGATKGESGKPWKGFDPSSKNRHWAIPRFLAEQMPLEFGKLGTLAKLDALYEAELIEIKDGTVWPTPLRYLSSSNGQPIQDIWAYQPYTEGTVYGTKGGIDKDVAWLGTTDPERLGYQTQKPIGLLNRIICSSCPENGLVLDPFCGCGTAIVASQSLNRQWIGIDITHLAISVLKWRLNKLGVSRDSIKVVGEPTDVESAHSLFKQSKYEFQYWVVDRVGGQPYGEKKKGADTGIDGYVYFMDEKDKIKKAIISVKGGKNIHPEMIRDLGHVVDREKAEMGIFLTLEEPTKPMKDEAIQKGLYHSPLGKSYPKIQIITVASILQGVLPNLPPWIAPIQPPKAQAKEYETSTML